MGERVYDVIVIGGGHAGVEAAWAAANLLGEDARGPSVALVTIARASIGVMSCNPAIGGLAKGQVVCEVDALGGLMGVAADATGIQFKVLNTSKGPAVHGPRCQSDKHAYADFVRTAIEGRPEIAVVEGMAETLEVSDGAVRGVGVRPRGSGEAFFLRGRAVVVTTGTFMRGLMHTGERKVEGGRVGESASVTLSAALRGLGLELGRLKTGTPPRLRRGSIDWDGLPAALGDDPPVPFSSLSGLGDGPTRGGAAVDLPSVIARDFPVLAQVECRQTHTVEAGHEAIRANLHRAPMFSGQIASVGPRYCPSIEDKVVRFAERGQHGVFLEPESHRSDWVYCNGIATSLPPDVQETVVRTMPGCARAEIVQEGYAVEYDMVRPHQIDAACVCKSVRGLCFAGQINGTSGYEEAAAQGVVAGINAALFATGRPADFTLGRDEAYIGVLMDDLVTKTPVEPYRMFTSRAEHRLMLRADNAPDRLTPVAERLGLLSTTALGRARLRAFEARRREVETISAAIASAWSGGVPLSQRFGDGAFDVAALRSALGGAIEASDRHWAAAWAEARYEPYLKRERAEIRRAAAMERRRLPEAMSYRGVIGLRAEAAAALERFRPATLGQAGRLEGVTPADVSLLIVHLKRGDFSAGAAVSA